MKKGNKIGRLLIIGVTLVLLTVGLSGCNEKYNPSPLDIDTVFDGQETTILPDKEQEEEEFIILPEGKVVGDIDKIEVIHYETSTEEWTHNLWTGSDWRKQANGFCVLYEYKPGVPEGRNWVNQQRHRVNGTVRNIAGKELYAISLSITFCDDDGNQVRKGSSIFGYGLENGGTLDFDFVHQRYMATSDSGYDSTASFVLRVRDASYLYT